MMTLEIEGNHLQSEIQQFYKEKTIFITGASGFLGRLLIEKLFRSCRNLKKIYILLREKKGKTPQDRFKEIFDVPAFKPLRSDYGDFLSKIFIIEGDLMQPNLGLSDTSIDLIKNEVDCVFHVGATVRFDEHIRKAAYINVRAVRDLMMLTKELKHLKSFVHVSTAYSNCVRFDIDEVFYEPPMSSENLLQLVECLEDEALSNITPTIIGNYPNTYTFTKAIAEGVVKELSKGLPVGVVRPSIVISSYQEPLPGWLDNIYGPTTILLGAALGLLRSLHGRKSYHADIVPVDFVINCLIAVCSYVAHNKVKSIENGCNQITEPKIFNYVNRPQNPITWGKYLELARVEALKIPSPTIIWHSTFDIRSNYYTHRLVSILTQTIPAYVVDFITRLIGKKPFFVSTIKKIDRFCAAIAYFTLNQWNFKNTNTQNLYNHLNPVDKKLYNFDMASMTWEKFFSTYLLGARLYLLKDPIDTIPQGRRKLIAVRYGHYVLVLFMLFLLYKFLMFFYYMCF